VPGLHPGGHLPKPTQPNHSTPRFLAGDATSSPIRRSLGGIRTPTGAKPHAALPVHPLPRLHAAQPWRLGSHPLRPPTPRHRRSRRARGLDRVYIFARLRQDICARLRQDRIFLERTIARRRSKSIIEMDPRSWLQRRGADPGIPV
jgi:hypothetical protein